MINTPESILAPLCMFVLAVPGMTQQKSIAERLGYPANSKLVILHADDLGVAHSVDSASFTALDQRAVSSASVMMPCPWVTEVAEYAKAHPDADIGLHLTLTSEWKNYRWGPVAPKDQVSSLLDPAGYFFPDVAPVALHAKPGEVEQEIRAQVELAMKMGIRPTHLDMHMGTLATRADFYAALVKVAHEYNLPFLAVRVQDAREQMMESLLSPKDFLFDSLIIFDNRVPAQKWTESYAEAIKAIKPGLHYMIVHLGHDDSELEGVMAGHPDYGAAWRQRDFDAVTSEKFKKALKDNHIILIGWKDLQKLM